VVALLEGEDERAQQFLAVAHGCRGQAVIVWSIPNIWKLTDTDGKTDLATISS